MPYKDKQKQKDYLRKYRKINRVEKLGTTDFDEHMTTNKDGSPDFVKESQEIKEELRRLRLCKK